MPITKHHLYTPDINSVSNIFRVLGCPARLTILKYLLEHGHANNKQLVEYLQLKQSTVSEHLKQLISIDFVEASPMENFIRYTINQQAFQNLPLLFHFFE